MARRLIRAALLLNPRSAGNRHRRGMEEEARRLDIPYAEPDSPADLGAIYADFAAREVSVLAVDGGDGTVREALTALMAPGRAWRPRLALLPSGKINLIAHDVGWMRGGPDALAHLAGDQAPYLDTVRRPLLRLERAGHPPTYGMFLGAGAFTDAWRLANERIHARGIETVAAIPAAIAAMAWRTLRGRDCEGRWMEVATDRGDARAGARFLLLATTLHRLVLGIWPFHPHGIGPIRWLDVDAPPRNLRRALPALLSGPPRPWMEAEGYRSGRSQRLEIALDSPVVLDGEAFLPGADGRLSLIADTWQEFVKP